MKCVVIIFLCKRTYYLFIVSVSFVTKQKEISSSVATAVKSNGPETKTKQSKVETLIQGHQEGLV